MNSLMYVINKETLIDKSQKISKMQKQLLTAKQFIISLNNYPVPFNDLKHLLESKHSNLVDIFRAILLHPKYKQVAQQLVQNMLNNMYKMVSEKLQIHIIINIWKSQFLRLFTNNNNGHYQYQQQQLNNQIQKSFIDKGCQRGKQRKSISDNNNNLYWRVFMFLCQKMRSLKYTIRLNALRSFQCLLLSIIRMYSTDDGCGYRYGKINRIQQQYQQQQQLSPQQGEGFDIILNKELRLMLRKQQLVKVVSYSQGLFLQLLEDEYHEIRVTTLAVLELIALKTRYFSNGVSSNNKENMQIETTHSLKQTILYMLNDQHELVRERSLVAIYRITQNSNIIKSNVINIINNNIKNYNNHSKQVTLTSVFSPLNQQQMFTILMCLKQNNAVLREKVYECLKILSLTNIEQLLLVLQKLYQTLLVYKLDKTKIYMLLKQFSYSHKEMMLRFIEQNPKENIKLFYDFVSDEEPSCRNFIYKGRLILLREVIKQIIKINYSNNNNRKIRNNNSNIDNNNNKSCLFEQQQKYRNILPSYILRHLNYVQDTQIKLKLSQKHNKGQSQYSHQQKMLSQQQTQIFISNHHQPIVQHNQYQRLQNKHNLKQLKSVIQYELTVREQSSFDREFLSIITNSLKVIIDISELNEKKEVQFKIQEKSKQQSQLIRGKNQNNAEVEQIGEGEYCWFDVLGEPRQSDYSERSPSDHGKSNNDNYINHYQQVPEKKDKLFIEQQQILHLLYGTHHSNSNKHPISINHSKSEHTTTIVQKQQFQKQVSQLMFEIQALQYIFDLSNCHRLQEQHIMTIKHYSKISYVNRILSLIQQQLISILNNQEGSDSSQSKMYQVIKCYLRSPSIHTIIKSKQFKIRPITIGRVSGGSIISGGYSEKLLIIIQHPYKIASKEQFTFHNDNLWLQLYCINTNSNNNNNNPTMRVYLKFEDLFRLSEMRPLIDYNENKTIYTAELGVKINNTKFNNIVQVAANRSNNKKSNDSTKVWSNNHITRGVSTNINSQNSNRKVDEINTQKYFHYNQKEVAIASVAIIYSTHALTLTQHINDNDDTAGEMITIKQHPNQQHLNSHYKVLAQWSSSNNNTNAINASQ